jgi:hypothetical protein
MTGLPASLHPSAWSLLGWPLALAVCGAAAWALHVVRLRARERALTAVVAEREREWAAEREALARLNRRAAAGPSGTAGVERARLLVLTSLEKREDIGLRLASLDAQVDMADSSWSAAAACRDAVDAGRPYNLVLLDATLADRREAGWPDRLQADLASLGARVAVIRSRSGGDERDPTDRRDPGAASPRRAHGPSVRQDDGSGEEGTKPHEDPDRRGRSGFPATAAADAAAVGLRGRRSE